MKKNNDMQITSVVQSWLEHGGYEEKIEINAEDKTSLVKLYPQNSSYWTVIEINETKTTIEMYVYGRENVAVSQIESAWAWVREINTSMVMGRFAVIEDFPIQFKQAIDVDGGQLSIEMIDIAIGYAIQLFENHKEQIQEFSSQNPPIKLEDLTNTYEWGQIDGNQKVKNWSKELKAARQHKTTTHHWDMIGRGLILVNDDSEYCCQVLKTVAKEGKFNFVKIEKENVLNIPSYDELMKNAPLIIYLEPGRWKRDKRSDESESEEDTQIYINFRKKLIEYFGKFNNELPIIWTSSTSDLEQYFIDELKRVGLFDLYISIPGKSLDLSGKEFVDSLGSKVAGESLCNSYGKIGHMIDSYDTRKKELAVLALKRLHHEKKRPVEYFDLVEVDVHDLIEEGLEQEKNKKTRLQTAYHEAGHALMRICEYEGDDVSDYISILPGASGFAGVTAPSFGYSSIKQSGQYTFSDLQKRIRVLLAGRAGEEILVGSGNISSGASDDLRKATDRCDDYFGWYGFHPEMSENGKSGANLRIITGTPTNTEQSNYELLTRQFLDREYATTLKILNEHGSLLEAISRQLIKDPIMSQDELAEICIKHGVKVKKY